MVPNGLLKWRESGFSIILSIYLFFYYAVNQQAIASCNRTYYFSLSLDLASWVKWQVCVDWDNLTKKNHTKTKRTSNFNTSSSYNTQSERIWVWEPSNPSILSLSLSLSDSVFVVVVTKNAEAV